MIEGFINIVSKLALPFLFIVIISALLAMVVVLVVALFLNIKNAIRNLSNKKRTAE